MLDTPFGIVISTKFEQYSNVNIGMLQENPSSKFTVVKLVQFQKTSSPNAFNVLGNVIDIKLLQSWNALPPMLSIPDGNPISVKLLQL